MGFLHPMLIKFGSPLRVSRQKKNNINKISAPTQNVGIFSYLEPVNPIFIYFIPNKELENNKINK